MNNENKKNSIETLEKNNNKENNERSKGNDDEENKHITLKEFFVNYERPQQWDEHLCL